MNKLGKRSLLWSLVELKTVIRHSIFEIKSFRNTLDTGTEWPTLS